MSGLMYRPNQPTNLYDLLAQQQNQDQGPSAPAPPAASQPSAVQNTGGLSPQDRQKLIDVLLAPEDPGPAPTVKKANPIAQALMAVGDAGSTFAAILGGNGGVRTNAFEQYQNRLAQQQAELKQYQEKAAQSRTRAKDRTANYLLSQDDQQRAAQERASAARDLKELTLASQKADREARIAENEAKRVQDQAQFDAQQKAATAMENLRFEHDKVTAGIRERANAGDKQAAEDAKGLSGIYGTVSALAATAKQNLVEGKTTPDELQSLVESEIDQATMLSPDGRKAAYLYVAKKLAPIVNDFTTEKLNKELAANGPDISQGGTPTVGGPISIGKGLRSLGSVRQPQKY